LLLIDFLFRRRLCLCSLFLRVSLILSSSIITVRWARFVRYISYAGVAAAALCRAYIQLWEQFEKAANVSFAAGAILKKTLSGRRNR
jgi:hypothetical protein